VVWIRYTKPNHEIIVLCGVLLDGEIEMSEIDMKRKPTAIVIILALVMVLAGCGNGGATPALDEAKVMAFEAYSEIMRNISIEGLEYGAFDIDFEIELRSLTTRYDADNIITNSSGNMRMIVDGNELRFAMIVTTVMDASEMDFGDDDELDLLFSEPILMEAFIRSYDGELVEYHMAMNGEELSTTPSELHVDLINLSVADSLNIPTFNIDAINAVEIEEAFGNTVISMILDEEQLLEFMFKVMNIFLEETEDAFEDFILTIVVDSNKNPISMTMEMGVAVDFNYAFYEIQKILRFTFNGFGDDVQIMM